jgi:hypothetical protein
MKNESNPSPSQEGKNSKASRNKTGDKGGNNEQNEIRSVEPKTRRKPKTALIFGAFESLGLIFWQIADNLAGVLCVLFHWVSICLIAGGFFAVWHSWTTGTAHEKRKKRCLIWCIIFPIVCIPSLPITFKIWYPHPPKAEEAHLQLGFSVTGLRDVPLMLTNPKFKLPVKWSTNDNKFGFAYSLKDSEGFISVPFLRGASNLTAQFVLWNQSGLPTKVGRLLVSIESQPPFTGARYGSGWFEAPLQEKAGLIAWKFPEVQPAWPEYSPPIKFDTYSSVLTEMVGKSPISAVAGIMILEEIPTVETNFWGVKLFFMPQDLPGKPHLELGPPAK